MRRLLAVVLAFSTAPFHPSAAGGEDGPAAVTAAADRAIDAARRGDAPALSVLASSKEPSPWLVVDEILGRGERAAADSLARALAGPERDALSKYVASRKDETEPRGVREEIRGARALVSGGEPLAGLARLAGLKVQDDAVWATEAALGEADAHDGLGSFAMSAAASLRAADIAERIGWRARAIASLERSGQSAWWAGDFPTCRARWTRMADLLEKDGDRSSAVAKRADLVGTFYYEGDYPRALETHAETWKALVAYGTDLSRGRALGNVGLVYAAIGHFAKALSCENDALTLLRRAAVPGEEADILSRIGTIRYSLGQFEEALESQASAMKAFQSANEADGIALAHANRGLALVELETYGEADKELRAALEYYRALPVAAGQTAKCLTTLGYMHIKSGDPAAAEAELRDALSIHEGRRDRRGTAEARELLGEALRRQKKYAEAAAELATAEKDAIAIGADVFVDWTRIWLARTRLDQGDARGAVTAARAALAAIARIVTGLGDDSSASVRSDSALASEVGAAAALSLGEVGTAVEFLETARAGAFLESMGGRDALWHAVVPASLRAERREASRHLTLARSALRIATDGGVLAEMHAAQAAVDAAESSILGVAEKIRLTAKAAANLVQPRVDDLPKIRGRLGDGDVLVLYALPKDVDSAFAIVLDAKGFLAVHPLGPSQAIVEACEAMRLPKAPFLDEAAARRVRELVIDPLALPKGATRVLVVPDGCLCYMPWGYFLEGREVACLPSATTQGVLLADRDLTGKGVLALGDPDYAAHVDASAVDLFQSERAATTRGGGPLAPLPGTRDEAKAVGDVVLLGPDATEARLRETLADPKHGRWRAIHFACHGLVNSSQPSLSALALTSAGEDDGFLTALEVLETRMPADLIVLSACESGRGKILRGEGLTGLARAFMYAGAPRVIASLWKVDDEATTALMRKFYELWKGGRSTAAALRAAQEFVKDQPKWSRPEFWAPWVLWGLPE